MSSQKPADYRAPRWYPVCLLVVLLLAGTGVVQELMAPTPERLKLVLYSIYTLMMLAWIVDVLISRVKIDDESVLVSSLLGTRAIRLDQIDYVEHEGRWVKLRMKSGKWEKLSPDWLRVSRSTRRRVAAGIEAAVCQD